MRSFLQLLQNFEVQSPCSSQLQRSRHYWLVYKIWQTIRGGSSSRKYNPTLQQACRRWSLEDLTGWYYIFSTLIRWVKSPINQMNRDVVAKGTLEMKFVFLLSQRWIVLGSKLSSFKWVPWNILRPNLTHLNQFSPFRQIDAHFSPL